MPSLAEGRLPNLGLRHRPPEHRDVGPPSRSETIAQIELATNRAKCEKKVYVLPEIPDQKVARLHLAKLGAKLTVLSKEQAGYIGVPVEGPFKAERYRY